MKNILLALALVIGISSVVFAQDSKSVPAKPAEKKEVNEANQLRRTLEQKQLNAAPEKLYDSTTNNRGLKKKVKCKRKHS